MGSPDFAIPSLEHIHGSNHEVVSVVSNVDKRRGRGGGTSPTPVKKRALKLNLPVIEVEDLGSPDFIEQLQKLGADLFVVVAFRILPPEVLELPESGSVNLHASLLPKYRGAAPIHWAVMNGEEETGCSVFFLDEKVDTGAVIRQKATPIGENETTGDLYERLKKMGAELLLESLEDIEAGTYEATPQNEAEATPAPKLYTEDCKVNFQNKARKVHNKIRGLSPFPTAWATLDDLKFNMYRSRISSEDQLKPGQMMVKNEELHVGCGSGAVILDEVQIEGKRRMSGIDFMNGYSGIGLIR